MDVFDLVAKLTLDTKEYDKSLDNSEKSAMSFGSVLKTLGKGAAGAAVAGVTAFAAIGTATVATTKSVIDGASEVAAYGDNIDKMSQKMGLSIEAYQEWDAVMQHSGTSMETMKASMKTLANAVESGNEAFERIGLTQEELANMSQEEIFEATIAGLQNIEDTTERTYVAGKLLGRGATELGALLNMSAEDTQAMRDRVRELGGVMNEDAVKASAKFQDNLQDLQTAMSGIKRNILSELLPGLSDLTDGFTRLFSGEEGADELIESGTDKLLVGIENAGDKVLNLVTKIFPRVISGIGEHFPELVSSIAEMTYTLAPTILDAIGNVVLPTLLNTLPGVLTMLVNVVPPVFFNILEKVLEFLPEVLQLAVTLIDTLASGIADAIPVLIPVAIDVIMKLVDVLLNNLDVILDAAFKIINALAEGILDNLPEISLAITKVMYQIIATAISLLPQIISLAFQLIYTLISSMGSAIMEMLSGDFWKKSLNAIVESFTNIDWAGIGMKCLEGIADGFTKGWGKLKDSATNMVNGIKNIFTEGFDIHSPSRVFKQYGEMINEGLALGIDSGDSINAMENLSKNVSNAFNPSVSFAGSGAGGGDFIFPIFIGDELVQTQVVRALDIANYRSGGR